MAAGHARSTRRPSVPGGVWASALRTRLCATWARRSASPDHDDRRAPGSSVSVVARGPPRWSRPRRRRRCGADRPAPPGAAGPGPARPAAGGPRPGRPCGWPPPRSACSALLPPGLVGEAAPAAAARRSPGWRSGACAARARRRPRTGAAAPRRPTSRRRRPRSGSASRSGPSPRRPTSVPGRPSGTRRVRSPEAMASAVPAIWRSGRRPRRTTTRTSTPMASSTARLASSSTLRSEASVSLVGFSDRDVISVPWGTVTATVRYCAVGVALCCRRITASGSGSEGAGVAPDAHAAARCRAPAAPGCPWSGSGAGSGRSAEPEGRRQDRPARCGSTSRT